MTGRSRVKDFTQQCFYFWILPKVKVQATFKVSHLFRKCNHNEREPVCVIGTVSYVGYTHDSNARNDEKITMLKADYDFAGKGMFWDVIECMSEATNYKLRLVARDALAKLLGIAPEHFLKFTDDCINKYELLKSDGEFYWSDSLNKRMKQKVLLFP